MNIVPNSKCGINDGYVLKALSKNHYIRVDYYKYLNLFSHCYLNEDFNVDEYNYPRKLKSENDDLIFYMEIKKIIKSMNC